MHARYLSILLQRIELSDDQYRAQSHQHLVFEIAVIMDYSQFHEVFRPDVNAPYDQLLIRDIETKRKKLGGILFIDRVLKALGIVKGK